MVTLTGSEMQDLYQVQHEIEQHIRERRSMISHLDKYQRSDG